MSKKIITVFSIVVCLVMGGALMSQELAAGESHKCVVPYNIKVGSWSTGIHIFALEASDADPELFFISFESDDGWYKTVYLDMDAADHPRGWTGTIEELLALPEFAWVEKRAPSAPYIGPVIDPIIPVPYFPVVPIINKNIFKSPSCITVYSSQGAFTVSQFIIHAVNGYGFQTFSSSPTVSSD